MLLEMNHEKIEKVERIWICCIFEVKEGSGPLNPKFVFGIYLWLPDNYPLYKYPSILYHQVKYHPPRALFHDISVQGLFVWSHFQSVHSHI